MNTRDSGYAALEGLRQRLGRDLLQVLCDQLVERMIAVKAERELVNDFANWHSRPGLEQRLLPKMQEANDAWRYFLRELAGGVDEKAIQHLKVLSELNEQELNAQALGARPDQARRAAYDPMAQPEHQRPISEAAGTRADLNAVSAMVKLESLVNILARDHQDAANNLTLSGILKLGNQLKHLLEEVKEPELDYGPAFAGPLVYRYDLLKGCLRDMLRIHRSYHGKAVAAMDLQAIAAQFRAFPLWRELREIGLEYLHGPPRTKVRVQQLLKRLENAGNAATEILPRLPGNDAHHFELVRDNLKSVLTYQVKVLEKEQRRSRSP
ncbi:MAG TPA: hypothetical protein VF020_21145 [Chthoniobacterales bacterium]